MLALLSRRRDAAAVDKLRAAAALGAAARRRPPAGVAVELTDDAVILVRINEAGVGMVGVVSPREAWRLGRALAAYAVRAVLRGRAWRWR